MYFTTVQCITASNQPESLCGIELTVIRKGRLYQKKSWLFRPAELVLSPSPLGRPHLTLSKLMDCPPLHEQWDEIFPYFDKQLILFHQLPENIRALEKSISYHQLQAPTFTFGSTMMLAKRLLPKLTNTKLPTLCAFLEIPYLSHEPGDFSFSMAKAFLQLGVRFNVSDEEALFAKGGICLGSFRSDGICLPDFISPYNPPHITATTDAAPTSPSLSSLRHAVICFTGPLQAMTRSMAVKQITAAGAYYQSQITERTTILVTNLYDSQSGTYTRLTTKLQKALILKGQGQPIKIINEAQFMQQLKQATGSQQAF